MKGILLTLSRLPYAGMTIFPFIFLRKKDLPATASLLNHERIHLRQQLELLILPFYIWYLTAYLYHRLKGKNHEVAYRSIVFEKEAYKYENDPDYLSNRKFWAFLSETVN